jgi:hypothetical protein
MDATTWTFKAGPWSDELDGFPVIGPDGDAWTWHDTREAADADAAERTADAEVEALGEGLVDLIRDGNPPVELLRELARLTGLL